MLIRRAKALFHPACLARAQKQASSQKLAARSLFMLTATKAKVAPGKLLINGQWVEGSGHAFDTVNPATGEVLTQISEASAQDVDQAVTAARKAFDDPGSA
jgi:NAD-dependent SIR2 family protein deacetylase